MPFPSIASPSARLHTVTVGAGPTVVCLHSSGSSSWQWRRLFETEQTGYRLIAFDFHGHGRSPDFAGDDYALSTESDAIWQTLAAIDQPMHLVGHSFGGAVALDLAVRHPGRFASVTVYEPVLFGLLEPGSDEYREVTSIGLGVVDAVRAGDLDAGAGAFIDYWNGPGTWRALPVEQQERVRARIAPVARHFEALFANPLPAERLRTLRVPTLLLRGDRSPAAARAVCTRLAGERVVTTEVFPGLAHMGPVTHSAIVNPRIAAHLDAWASVAIAA